MECNKLPRYFRVHSVWVKECHQMNIDFNNTQSTTQLWQNFIEECGLRQERLCYVTIYDDKKWLFAKLKYGI